MGGLAPLGNGEPATESTPRVADKAGLLDTASREALEEKARQASERLQIDVVMVTTYGLDGKTLETYAEDCYREGGYGVGGDKSGVLYLLSLDQNRSYLYIKGKAYTYLTADNTEHIIGQVNDKIDRDGYAAGMDTLLKQLAQAAQNLEKTGSVNPPPRAADPAYILIVLLISLAAGGVAAFVIWRRYQPPTVKPGYPYQDTGRLNLNRDEDVLVDSHVTTRYIPPPPPPSSGGGGFSSGGFGGGSSTHTSSGGTTHGGGGMSFSSRSRSRTRTSSSGITHGGGGMGFGGRSTSRSHTSSSGSSHGGGGRSHRSGGGSRHGGGGKGF